MNSGQNVESQMLQSFLNYLPIADISQYWIRFHRTFLDWTAAAAEIKIFSHT